MTPQIFPGLKPPTSQLFFDLQAFIAENGGGLRLAERLETEWVKGPYRFDVRKLNITPVICRWREGEKNMINKISDADIALITGRTIDAVRQKRIRLHKQGLL